MRVTRDSEGNSLSRENQYVAKLHEEKDLAVADFLMVGLDPDSAKDMAENEPGKKQESDKEWEQGLVTELDDILEESII